MDYKEAIKWQKAFQSTYATSPDFVRKDVDEAVGMAINALKSMDEYEKLKTRNNPVQVVEVHVDEYYCPTCGAENSCNDGKIEDKFCPRCGQKLKLISKEIW